MGLKAAVRSRRSSAFGRSLGSLTQALDLGIIDRVGANPCQEVVEADLVLLATPVGQMPEIMARIAPYLGAQTLVTDGGSTKCDVVAAAREHFGDKVARFVPAHPDAGAENSGAVAGACRPVPREKSCRRRCPRIGYSTWRGCVRPGSAVPRCMNCSRRA